MPRIEIRMPWGQTIVFVENGFNGSPQPNATAERQRRCYHCEGKIKRGERFYLVEFKHVFIYEPRGPVHGTYRWEKCNVCEACVKAANRWSEVNHFYLPYGFKCGCCIILAAKMHAGKVPSLYKPITLKQNPYLSPEMENPKGA